MYRQKTKQLPQKQQKVEEGIQLNLKDLYSNKTFENIDEKKLKAFLDNAYLLVSNAIDSQIRDLYVEDESEEINTKNFTYRSLFKFPAINVDSNNKEDKKKLISDMIWNKSGDTLAVSFYEDMHIGPCAHSGFLKFFVLIHSILTKKEKKKEEKQLITKQQIQKLIPV